MMQLQTQTANTKPFTIEGEITPFRARLPPRHIHMLCAPCGEAGRWIGHTLHSGEERMLSNVSHEGSKTSPLGSKVLHIYKDMRIEADQDEIAITAWL